MIFSPGIALAGSFISTHMRVQNYKYPSLPFSVQLAPGDSLSTAVGQPALTNTGALPTSPIPLNDGAFIQTYNDPNGFSTVVTTGDGHTLTLKTQTQLAIKLKGDSAGFPPTMQAACDYVLLEAGGIDGTNSTHDAGVTEPNPVCDLVVQTKNVNAGVVGCTFEITYNLSIQQTVIYLYDAYTSSVGTPSSSNPETAGHKITINANNLVSVTQIAQNSLMYVAHPHMLKVPIRGPVPVRVSPGRIRSRKK